jgi:hypothetical protein
MGVLRCAEDLSAVAAVVFPAEEGVELLVAFEAVLGIVVPDPLLLGAEGSLDDLLHFFFHFFHFNFQPISDNSRKSASYIEWRMI